jgi:hypothetical protein
MTQLCLAKTKRQAPVVMPSRLMVQQQRQPFGVSEPLGLVIVGEARERLGHAGKAKSGEQVECGVCQHFPLVVIIRTSDVGVDDRLALGGRRRWDAIEAFSRIDLTLG